jgi:TetR/AcrR family transcriptional regulator, cholesterol catabolism regulator
VSHATTAGEMPAYKRERRKRIVRAAMAMLDEQDYEEIRIAAVAQRAEVALGTLYRYFSSKEHLYAVVLQEWLAHLGSAEPPPGRLPDERIRARVHAVIDAFARQPRFFKVLMLLYSSNDREVETIRAAIAANAHRLLAEDMHVLGSPTTEDAARMLWSIVSNQLLNAAFHDGSYAEVHRIADVYIGLLPDQIREAEQA